MKCAFAFLFALVCLAAPAFARDNGWTNYTGDKYGFTFSYPAQWLLYANVNTEFRAAGLASVADVCLTPGPVKTLSCQVVVYVIPEARFTPPAKGKFLGLDEQPNAGMPKESAWSASFVVSFGGSPADASTNYYAAHNGFVYLVTERGKPGEERDLARLRDSFRFSRPN